MGPWHLPCRPTNRVLCKCWWCRTVAPLLLHRLPTRQWLGEKHLRELLVVDLAVLVDICELERLGYLLLRRGELVSASKKIEMKNNLEERVVYRLLRGRASQVRLF